MNQTAKKKALYAVISAGVLLALTYSTIQMLTSSVSSTVDIDYHAGKIDASNNSSMSSSSVTSQRNSFSLSRIAILQADSHPALDLITEELRNDLLELAYVDEVDIYAPGQVPEPGGMLHDSFIHLSIDVTKDNKPLVERDFEAVIEFSAGAMPHKSHSSYMDHLTPPDLRYELDGEINHSSKSSQVGTPYKLIAENIADQLFEQLTKHFKEWHEKYAVSFDWPEDLIGEYPDDTTIPWPDGVEVDLLSDGYGLLRHRHALWAIDTDDPISIVQAFHQAYVDAGWDIESGEIIEDDEHHQRLHFRAWSQKATLALEVFEMRDGYGERKPGEVSRVCVRYEHRMDRPYLREVIDQLMADEANLHIVSYLKRFMDQPQLDRYYQVLTENPLSDPVTLLDLARHQHRKDQNDEARRNLILANMNAHRAPDMAKMRTQIKEEAKKMGFEDVTDPPLTAESLEGLGFRHVSDLVDSPLELALQEPVRFYYEDDERMNAIDLWVEPITNQPGDVKVCDYRRHSDMGASWSSNGNHALEAFSHIHTYPGDQEVITIRMSQSDADPQRVTLLFEVMQKASRGQQDDIMKPTQREDRSVH